jgi:hypothetical protein
MRFPTALSVLGDRTAVSNALSLAETVVVQVMKALLFILPLLLCLNSYGQKDLTVSVISNADNEPVPFCDVEAFQRGKLVSKLSTDFDGKVKMRLSDKTPVVISIVSPHFVFVDTVVDVSTNETIELRLDTTSVHLDYRNIYNAAAAYEDLKNGKVKILFTGLVWADDQMRINDCCHAYGFEYVFTTDVIDHHLKEAVKNYNEVVIAYLDILNEGNWIEKLAKDCGIKIKPTHTSR